MSENTVNIAKTITATDLNGGAIVPIYSPSQQMGDYTYTGFLTDLRIRVFVPSLTEVNIPTIEIGKSNTEKYETVRDYEWNTDRFELDFLMSIDSTNFVELFVLSLKNNPPYVVKDCMSYLTNNPAYAISQGTTLAIRCRDVGYGLPTGVDRLDVFGVVREEINTTLDQPIQQATQQSYSIPASALFIALNANPARKGAVIQNVGNRTLWILFGDETDWNKGIKLSENMQYEINYSNLFVGKISLYAQSSTNEVRIVEFT